METDTRPLVWIVARTIANTELNLRTYFEEHSIECFVPTKKVLIKRREEVVEKEIPIIHNLIFFRADFSLAQQIFNRNTGRLFRVRGVKGLLTVPDRQMEPFVRFINANNEKVQIWDTHYAVGDRMMIKKGPFAGWIGKVVQIDNKNYFTVTLEGLLTAAMKFPKSNLIKVDKTDQ